MTTGYSDKDYENFFLHFNDEQERKRYRPRWSNVEAVLSLFDDEEFIEWTADFPTFPGNPVEEALESGDHVSLLHALKELTRRRRRGERGPTSKAKRAWRYPVHKAAFMMPEAEEILRWVYPEQPKHEIRDRALMVVGRMTGVNTETVRKYLSRPKKDRRRLV